MPGTFTIPLWEVIDIEKDAGNGFRLGLNDYPIFDPEYRDKLNTKIIRHFWNREIGHETISQFTFAMRRKMWEIMPLYNQVYLSTQLEFDPLKTMNIHTVRADTGSGTITADANSDGTAVTNSAARAVQSDTPQTQLSGDEDYASGGTDTNSASTSSNSGTQHNTSSNTNQLNADVTVSGYQAIPSDLLLKYRSTLLNVDMMVVGELNELFMGIWGSVQEMSPINQLGWAY